MLQLFVTMVLPVLLLFIAIPWLFIQVKRMLQRRGVIKPPPLEPNNPYFRKFLYSFVTSLPGLLLYGWLVWQSNHGVSGTEFVALIYLPLFLISFVGMPLTILFGIPYALKERGIKGKVLASIVCFSYAAFILFLFATRN